MGSWIIIGGLVHGDKFVFPLFKLKEYPFQQYFKENTM